LTTAQDLRELAHELDAALTGWPWPRNSSMTTETGRAAERLTRQLRERHYKQWTECCVMRGRLVRALADVEGLRASNEALTNELERLRGP
jgi:hypothetical protein